MLSENVTVDRYRRHPQVVSQQGPKAGRVQNGTASITCRFESRKLGHHLRDHINRVGDGQEQSLWREPEYLGNHLLENLHVSFEKLKARFPRTLTHTAGENDNTGGLELRIVSCHDTDRMGKGGSREGYLLLGPEQASCLGQRG